MKLISFAHEKIALLMIVALSFILIGCSDATSTSASVPSEQSTEETVSNEESTTIDKEPVSVNENIDTSDIGLSEEEIDAILEMEWELACYYQAHWETNYKLAENKSEQEQILLELGLDKLPHADTTTRRKLNDCAEALKKHLDENLESSIYEGANYVVTDGRRVRFTLQYSDGEVLPAFYAMQSPNHFRSFVDSVEVTCKSVGDYFEKFGENTGIDVDHLVLVKQGDLTLVAYRNGYKVYNVTDEEWEEGILSESESD